MVDLYVAATICLDLLINVCRSLRGMFVRPSANVAPVNPGGIPAATIVTPQSAAQQALQNRTSIGGGMSPSLISQVIRVL